MFDLGYHISHGLDVPVLAETLMRAGTGAFFAISGYHKLFNPQRHATLKATLTTCGVPYIQFMQWWVPGVEFFGGLAVAVGFFAPMAALGLITICMVATCTDGLRRIMNWNPIDQFDVLDDLLYLPEILYLFMLLLVILEGSGPFSVDYLLFG